MSLWPFYGTEVHVISPRRSNILSGSGQVHPFLSLPCPHWPFVLHHKLFIVMIIAVCYCCGVAHCKQKLQLPCKTDVICCKISAHVALVAYISHMRDFDHVNHYINISWRSKGFFQFETIINVLFCYFRFIWKPMLWVYDHYKYLIFKFFQWGDRLYTSESDVCRRYKNGPRDERV